MLYVYIMSIPYYNSNNFDSPNYLTDEDVIRQKTLNLIFNGLLFTAVICFMIILFPINPIYYGLAVAVEFIVIIMRFFVRSEENLEKLYYVFVVATSVTLGFLFSVVLSIEGGFEILTSTLSTTGLIVGGIYYFTYVNKPDVQYMRKYLFLGLLLILILSIYTAFVAVSDIFILFLSIAGACLFAFYLFYDLGRLMKGNFGSPAILAWNIYWDIVLLLKYIVRIFLVNNSRSR